MTKHANISKNKKNSEDKKKRVVKRRKKAEFRVDFKKRAIFSYGKSIVSLKIALELCDNKDMDAGYFVCESIKHLAHALEMFSKSVIKKVSPFLLIEKLDEFNNNDHFDLDNLYKSIEQKQDTKYCAAKVAFCRAVKLIKNIHIYQDLKLLLTLIDDRNLIEHKDGLAVINIKKKIEETVRNMQSIEKLYKSEYGKSSILNQAIKLIEKDENINDLKSSYQELCLRVSDDMKNCEKEKKKLLKEKNVFINCKKCFYDFGKLSADKKSYECTWCGHKGYRLNCSTQNCNSEAWSDVPQSNWTCLTHQMDNLRSTSTRNLLNWASGSASVFLSTSYNEDESYKSLLNELLNKKLSDQGI